MNNLADCYKENTAKLHKTKQKGKCLFTDCIHGFAYRRIHYTMAGASNTRPAGHKWPAKGFKVARTKGFCIGWLIDTSALTL